MATLTLELLQQEIEYAALNNDWAGAFEAYNIVSRWLKGNDLVKNNPREYNQYLNYVVKLKFLALNYFDDVNEYYDLLKNYFSLSQEIPDFDLWSKLEVQLITLKNINERDAFKNKLKDALEKSDNLLIGRRAETEDSSAPHKVSEWIKDFIVNLGLDSFDKLKKMEYIANGKYIKRLTEAEKNKVRNLLDVYEKLRFSSKTPAGYENSVVMNIDGKTIIFNHGEIEEVSKDFLKQIQDKKISPQSQDNLLINSQSDQPAPAPSPAAEFLANPLVELEQALQNYSPGSLEYKALGQEISRLKKAELRQAQKSDALK